MRISIFPIKNNVVNYLDRGFLGGGLFLLLLHLRLRFDGLEVNLIKLQKRFSTKIWSKIITYIWRKNWLKTCKFWYFLSSTSMSTLDNSGRGMPWSSSSSSSSESPSNSSNLIQNQDFGRKISILYEIWLKITNLDKILTIFLQLVLIFVLFLVFIITVVSHNWAGGDRSTHAAEEAAEKSGSRLGRNLFLIRLRHRKWKLYLTNCSQMRRFDHEFVKNSSNVRAAIRVSSRPRP